VYFLQSERECIISSAQLQLECLMTSSLIYHKRASDGVTLNSSFHCYFEPRVEFRRNVRFPNFEKNTDLHTCFCYAGVVSMITSNNWGSEMSFKISILAFNFLVIFYAVCIIYRLGLMIRAVV